MRRIVYSVDLSKKTAVRAHLLSLLAALQQVNRLVVLQVADTGISPFSQQQPQDLLLVGVTMETSCHM